MSNFSFSHRFFKRIVLQTCRNRDLFKKGLNVLKTICPSGMGSSLDSQQLGTLVCLFNPYGKEKKSDLSKLKEFANNKSNVAGKEGFSFKKVVNTEGRG